tara:strand:+ start:439 stop:555 length:117 start_codon:yes stop_codon:yes gene_type:complete
MAAFKQCHRAFGYVAAAAFTGASVSQEYNSGLLHGLAA